MVINSDEVLARHLESDWKARAEWGRDHKLRNDPRVTPIGSILRRTSVDELPQLINVVKGEMSLVGPRPIVDAEISRYGEAIEDYISVRPGLTGPWQVTGRNTIAYERRVQLDQEYARSWSLQKDVSILLKTVGAVISGNGSY